MLVANTQTQTYGFVANSDLIGSITRTNGVNTAISYESTRDLISSMTHTNASSIATFGYGNDALGRRSSMSKTGSAFSQNDSINYGYNDRSEVTSALAQNDSSYNYAYSFDYIGNRSTATERGTNIAYTSNNLNQYTLVDSQNLTYDDDGNITVLPLASGTWTGTWNAENRLVSLEKSDMKLEFVYDYIGRRIEKKVYSGSTGNWTLSNHKRFIYNGYRLVQTLDAMNSNAPLQEFTWSLDDELRAVTDKSTNEIYMVHHDANRNVTDLTDSSGALAAHYEYGPFGQITVSNGSYASTNPFRFSSEYYDEKTGLVYYNYRYYSPSLGRWLTRDPIVERGGSNIYAIARNRLLNYIDMLGLEDPISRAC